MRENNRDREWPKDKHQSLPASCQWDHGHDGKDLDLSSEVFPPSPAPHDLIGSDIREITVLPVIIVTLAVAGLDLQGHTSTRRFGTTKNYLLGLTEARRAIWLHSLAQLHSLTALSAMSDRLSVSRGLSPSWELQNVPCGTHPVEFYWYRKVMQGKTLFCLFRPPFTLFCASAWVLDLCE